MPLELGDHVWYWNGRISFGQNIPRAEWFPGSNPNDPTDYGQYPGKFNWHNFLIFPSWEAGFNAIALYLRTPRYVNLSITQAMEVYAPASDGNDAVRYAQEVADAAGIPASTLVGDLSDEQMLVMQNKIQEIEGAIPGESLAWDSSEIPDVIRNELPM
jgi:hypothetical protein